MEEKETIKGEWTRESRFDRLEEADLGGIETSQPTPREAVHLTIATFKAWR